MESSKKIYELLKFVKFKLDKKSKIFFLFDYDGVLVPLQHNPDTAYLKSDVKISILRLSKSKKIKIALVSGRNLSMLKKLTKLKSTDIVLIGTHGLEMFHNKTTRHLFDKNLTHLKAIKKEAVELAHSIVKGFLEHKPYSFTYHIRDSRKEDLVEKLGLQLKKFIKEKKLNRKLKVLKGKKMVEIMPKDVTKGKAVEEIIKMYPDYFYIYFGDDITDISAFQTVRKNRGIAISLNPKLHYKADYYLKSSREVKNFIQNAYVLTHIRQKSFNPLHNSSSDTNELLKNKKDFIKKKL